MIADAHLHLFRRGFRSTPGADGAELASYEALRAEHGIGLGLVIGYEAEGIDPDNNAYLAGLAAVRPWIRSLAYLPIEPAPSPERVAALLTAGHIGIAAYLPDTAAGAAFARWPASVWQALEARHAILSLNARPEATARIVAAVEAAKGCAFLFSHLGLPGAHSAPPTPGAAAARLAPLLDLASRPNVRVKLSGLYAVDPTPPHRAALPFVELLLDAFGSARCHWGSDFSPALETVTFPETLKGPWSDLSAGERDLVMGKALVDLLSQAGR